MAEFGLTDNQFKVLELLLDPRNKDLTGAEIAEQVGITERYVRALRNSGKYRRFQEVLLEERRRAWEEAVIEAMPDIVDTMIRSATTTKRWKDRPRKIGRPLLILLFFQPYLDRPGVGGERLHPGELSRGGA